MTSSRHLGKVDEKLQTIINFDKSFLFDLYMNELDSKSSSAKFNKIMDILESMPNAVTPEFFRIMISHEPRILNDDTALLLLNCHCFNLVEEMVKKGWAPDKTFNTKVNDMICDAEYSTKESIAYGQTIIDWCHENL